MRLKWAALASLGLVLVAWAWLEGAGWELGARTFAELIAWMNAQQRALHADLVAAIRAVASDSAAQGALVGISFAYGVFHAAGPGHGKAVLTAYLVTHPEHVARGVWLAVASAFCQGAVAIALVYGLLFVAGWIPRELGKAVTWAERASFLLVMVLGALLLARAAASAWRRLREAGARRWPALQRGAEQGGHVHGLHDVTDRGHTDCGHNHGPSVQQIARAGHPLAALGVVLSIGARPCTGAILVLVFAHVLALPFTGVLAVVAMSAGTAITVAALAFGSVHLRGWVGRLAAGRASGWLLSLDLLAAAGGAFLLATGYALLAQSWAPAHPLGL